MKPAIIISAVNLRSGGTLSVLLDVLDFAQNELLSKYRVVALVHRHSLFDGRKFDGIEFIEFPDSVGSYAKRLYLEYFHFKKISKKLKPYLWFSLHDITPNVSAQVRAVYCHNPSPFYNLSFNEAKLDKKFFFFNLFYKWLYVLNIKKNNYVVVQQNWLRNEFSKNYGIDINKIVVAYPSVVKPPSHANVKNLHKSDVFTFFYPSFPRVFKNFEVILAAVKILNSIYSATPFEVVLTIDGTENTYAKHLVENFRDLSNVRFIGLLSRDEVFEQYQKSDCLIFPSKLETWGLPLTEAKEFGLPIIASDLPYAYETIGNYDRTLFFDSNNSDDLAAKMIDALNNKFQVINDFQYPVAPYAANWQQLFNILLEI
jgi:glycosyltransferase involved in cell wall biosynthesis